MKIGKMKFWGRGKEVVNNKSVRGLLVSNNSRVFSFSDSLNHKSELQQLISNNKLFILITLFLLITLITIQNISSIGITPGRTTINFEPSLQKQVSFSVVNTEKQDMSVVFTVSGELADYITLNQAYAEFSAGEEVKSHRFWVFFLILVAILLVGASSLIGWAVKIPILGMGGISNGLDAIEFIEAGATTVGIGSGVYYHGIGVFKKVCMEMEEWMKKNGVKSLDEIRGAAHG